MFAALLVLALAVKVNLILSAKVIIFKDMWIGKVKVDM